MLRLSGWLTFRDAIAGRSDSHTPTSKLCGRRRPPSASFESFPRA
jgi:hypothetical protein